MNFRTLLVVASLAAFSQMAHAQVADVTVGLMQHNIKVTDGKNADKEDGPDVSLELHFKSPDFLSAIGSPQPGLVASLNTAGNTSYAGVTLTWDFALADNWHFEPSLGYIIHNGEVSNPFPNGDPRATEFSNKNVLLGSEDLFRTALSLTYDFNESWAGQLTFEHISHGQILGSGRNQGMDNIGLRAVRRF
jgi:lipid A 3-O-deacylase